MGYTFPDYDRSSLSITASVLGYFGVKGLTYPKLPEIEEKLHTYKPQKVVLLLADGMGENLLSRFLPEDSFLRSHDAGTVSAVFPSTTTAATTSIWTGLSPLEHGWLGWSLYFKECAAQIDTFIGRESHTGAPYPAGSPADTLMELPATIAGVDADVETLMVFPFDSAATKGAKHKAVARDLEQIPGAVIPFMKGEGRKLCLIYNGEPDHTMHAEGVACEHTKHNFERVDAVAKELAAQLDGDTLLIVTADHGLVDATGWVVVNEIPELDECLWMPPAIEGRAAAFYVKPFRRAQFEAAFEKYCGGDFLLLKREEALARNLFGRGRAHPKSEDFMGDYIACATGMRNIFYKTIVGKIPDMIGQHAGLTEDEMTVPVVLAMGENGK